MRNRLPSAAGGGGGALGRRLAPLLFVALVLAVHLANLGGGTLDAWDEGLSGERAREMLAAGSWWTPLLGGEPDWNKPPLYYWLSAAGYRVFGVSELAVRLPSVLFGLVCAALVYAIARQITQSRAGGLLAAALLVANPHWIGTVRQGLLESGLAAAMLAGGWTLAVPAPSARRALAAGALIGLGALIKSPLAVVAFAVPLAAWRPHAVPSRSLWIALGAFAVVGGAWYALQTWLYGRAFLDFYVGYNIWARATTGIEGQRTELGLYARKAISEAPLALIAFVVPLGWAALRDRAQLRAVAPLLAFIALWLALIHLAVSKRPFYLAPAYPFMAAASAPLVLAMWRRIPSERARYVVATSAAVAAATLFAARYNAALNYSPDAAAAARNVAARAAPGDALLSFDVPLQLVGFYAQRDVRHLRPQTWAPSSGRIWVLATRRGAERARERLAPGRPMEVECRSELVCVLAIGPASEPD